MLEALERHPNALRGARAGAGARGAGLRTRICSTVRAAPASGRWRVRSPRTLLAHGAPDPASAQARALAGAHPDLTWVVPSGAHEILVSDIDEPVVAAAAEDAVRVGAAGVRDRERRTARRRGRQPAAEDARGAGVVRASDPDHRPAGRRAADDPLALPGGALRRAGGAGARGRAVGGRRRGRGRPQAYARLSLGDAGRARALAEPEGVELRERALELVRRALAGEAGSAAPWDGLLAAVRARGERVRGELEERAGGRARAASRVAIASAPRRSGTSGSRRARRRVETGALELALDLVETWLLDLAALAFGAADLVRNSDRLGELRADAAVGRGADAGRCAARSSLVEDTRQRFQLNVSEDLALEALTYRLEQVLAG